MAPHQNRLASLRRPATALLAAAIAAATVVLPVSPAFAAPTVTISAPVDNASGIQAGVPFTVTVQSSTNVDKIAFSASGCVFTPATVTGVTGGQDVSVTANCPVGTTAKTIAVKATDSAGASGSASRPVTFDNTTPITPVVTLNRAALPMCTGKGSYAVKVETPGGAGIFGVPVTGSLSTDAGPSTLTGKTDATGTALLAVTLADTSTLSASSAAVGAVAAGGPSATKTLTTDACSLKTTITSSPASTIDYLASATIAGKTEFLRASDGATAPAGSSSVVISAGGINMAKAKTAADGTFTATFPLLSGGQWAAVGTTAAKGLTSNTSTGVGGTTTMTPYNGTFADTAPALPKVGYFVAGNTAKYTATLTAKDPGTNAASEVANKGQNLKGIFVLSGDTGGMAFSSKLKTGKGGLTKISGLVGGNGAIVLDVDNLTSPGVSATALSTPVSAQARVRLTTSGKSVPETGKLVVRVTAFPLITGTATLEIQAGKDAPWTTLTTVPLNQKTSITPPAAGSYNLRAVTAATAKADAGTSKALALTVVAAPAAAAVTDLSCLSTGGTAPVCTWTAPIPAAGQNVTGYTVKAGTGVYTISDPNTTTFTVPDTFTSPTTGKTAALWTLGKATKVSVTPIVDAGKAVAGSAASTPQATPANFTMRQTGTTATLTWTAVKSAEEGYWLTVDGGAPVGSLTTGYTFKGLSPAAHTFALYAKNINGDTSAVTTTSLAATAQLPDAPAAVSPTAGNGSVDLDWTVPLNDGYTPITDYVVQYRTSPSGAWTTFADGTGTGTSTTVTGLANGTAYDFQVAAVNIIGTGAFSPSATATPRTVPNAPTGLTATPGASTIALDWAAPGFDGGSAITDYVIEYSDVSASSGFVTFADGTSTTTNTTVTGLSAGTQYWFRVSTVNAVGQSTGYASATATPFTAPSAPTITTTTPGLTSMGVAWSAPSSNGGSPITDYEVEYATAAGGPWTTFSDAVSTATSTTVTGLSMDTTYWFRVHAVNVIGQGANSASVSDATFTTPGAPTITVTTPGLTTMALTWTAPSSNGGSPITDYVIDYATSGTGPWTTFNDGVSATTSATVTGLALDSTYWFRVRAVNAVGAGPNSATASDATFTKPGAPTITVTTPGLTTMALTWTAPSSNGGSPITDYAIDYSSTSASTGFATFNDGVSTSLSATVTGLTAGTTYWFRVRAINAVGAGPNSSVTSASTAQPLSLNYTTTQFARNQSGQQLSPTTANGTAPFTYSVSGTLPTGVTFNTSTGVFTGPNLNDYVNGDLDATMLAAQGTAANNTVRAAAQNADGTYLLGGAFTAWNGTTVGRLVKLNTDGTLNTTFNTNIGTGANGDIYVIKVQSDGKIVVAGAFTTWNGTTTGRLVRLNADGTKDTTFATNIGTGVTSGIVYEALVLTDGSIAIGGTFTTFNGGSAGKMYMLNSNGTANTAYNANNYNGTQTTAIYALAQQASGKILVGGQFNKWGTGNAWNVIRLDTAGVRDATFDSGKGQAATGIVKDIAIQSDGKYIVAGAITAWDGVTANGVVRLNSDDTNDTTFNTNTVPGVSTGATINSIALSSTGKVMLAGTFTSWGGSGNAYIVWLNTNGTKDTAWTPTGPNGTLETAIYQSSGLPLAGGSFTTWNGTTSNRVAFMRLTGQRPTPGFPAALTVTVNDAGGQTANKAITLTVAP